MPDIKTIPANRRKFLVQTTTVAALAALAVSGSLVACGDSSAEPAQFKYGVASGDPLASSVILWTHAKIAGSINPVGLSWQLASDSSFTAQLQSGRVNATEATDFTAKVDVLGLTAGNNYFYRFVDDAGVVSPVGNTRTLPASSATTVKFAVFSCALFSEGYFNTYDAAAKSDAEYAIHLGDYIYEYGADPAKYGNTNAVVLGRVGVEFAGSSVSSSGFESVGLGALASSLDGSVQGATAVGAGLGLIDDLLYADTIRRGYLLVTVTAASVKGDYVFVSTVKSATYSATVGKSITVAANGALTYA